MAELDARFAHEIKPFLQTYCVSCHNPDKSKGDLDLTPYGSVDAIASDSKRWSLVRERIEAGEMPPEKAKAHPTAELRAQAIDFITAVRKFDAMRNAGDPGPVYARRLNAAEYDYTIRDLTGVDIRPARQFPVDPANQAGFDNSGESLTMTPSLVKKYFEAARMVSDYLVLTPDGLEFAPHPVLAETDRDKFCVNRIIAFYRRQRTDCADYFEAAWQFQNRAALGRPTESLDAAAARLGLSRKYLATIWPMLNGKADPIGPIAALRAMWQALPNGGAEAAHHARAECERMRDFVVSLRQKLVPFVPNLTAPRMGEGSQPLVLWKDRQMAANRMKYCGGAMKVGGDALPEGSPDGAIEAMAVPAEDDAAARQRYEKTFERFCTVFPDAFYISERARVFLDPKSEKGLGGRLLSAGFHNQMGYFRDDGPLYELMLDDAQRRELDRLWTEFDFVASIPHRQYAGFLWSERVDSSFMVSPEFAFARSEDKDNTSEPKMAHLEEVYLAKAVRTGAGEVALQAIRDYFHEMSARVRRVEQTRVSSEPSHLRDLLTLAERAYRRPLSDSERDGIAAFYHLLRDKDGLDHEDAVRDTLVSILMSPNFCYRLDLPGRGAATARGAVRPLDDYALASRLSYFLWSSMPDQDLLDLASAGKLHQPDVLVAQARRMLKDDRATGFATEFAGNWLDFRRFQEHNGVDRGRFPEFTNDLREAMFEEPVRFFVDLARRDGSVLDFLYGDYTFVNPSLAQHYGMPAPGSSPNQWTRVDGANRYGRGGLLPMAVFLTKNSPGLRTSPVKRGNWLVKRLLGEQIPPPPAKVPELPSDESKLGTLTLRETLERHRADPSCAACHARFDSFGLVFEGYGPVGERRDKDLGGRPVDATAVFPNGKEGAGLDGLRAYIRQRRQNDFVDNLCREMLAYGLGRTLLPSDDSTIETMRAKLAAEGYRFDSMIETIVTSPQFLNKRVNAELSKE